MAIKAKTKQEIASEYFPYISDHSALNRLRAWINNCPGLIDRLRAIGYQLRQRILTSQQVSLVYEYLGEPLLQDSFSLSSQIIKEKFGGLGIFV